MEAVVRSVIDPLNADDDSESGTEAMTEHAAPPFVLHKYVEKGREFKEKAELLAHS